MRATRAVIEVPFAEIDGVNYTKFKELLQRYRPTDDLVVDMRNVVFFDSHAIGALLAESQLRSDPESIRLRNVREQVARALEVCGLNSFVHSCYDDGSSTATQ